MGKFGEFLESAGNATADGLTGGLASGITGAVGGLFGMIGAKKRMKRQVEAQKELNEQAAKLNYEYGEKAAENAYKRQMEMYERSYQDQSYAAMRGQMEDAGLSVGLMYGGGGSGGAGGATTGAPQGETGGAEAGRADGPAAQQAAAIQQAQMGLGLVSMKKDLAIKDAQIEEINAAAEKQRAEAANITEQKITTVQSRDALVQKLIQEGMKDFISNVQNKWRAFAGKDWGGTPGEVSKYGERNELYGFYGIAENSYVNEEEAMKIAKGVAETNEANASGEAARALANLNNKRANGYWQELLNATVHAKADEVRAAAAKLSAEFETGEYTNWKTWAELAKSAIGAIAVSKIGGVK